MEELKQQLKAQIIQALNLEEVAVEDINDADPLFGEGLGLDSIDALELIVLLEKNYGIRIKDASIGKQIFRSVNVLADYVSQNRTK